MKDKKKLRDKVWSWRTADKKHREKILNRDKVCQRCKRSDRQLQISHYWDRQYYATRWDDDNCIILCAWCHTLDPDGWEQDRNKEYQSYMLKKLGAKGYESLKQKHYKSVKRRDAIIELMDKLGGK